MNTGPKRTPPPIVPDPEQMGRQIRGVVDLHGWRYVTVLVIILVLAVCSGLLIGAWTLLSQGASL